MTPLSPRSPRLFSTALSFTVLCALALLSASAAAFPIADAVYLRLNTSLAIHPVELYAGCDLAPEYAARAALLCRGIVFQTFLLLAAHYVSFEMPLLIFLFVLRGLSFGLAFRLCLHLHAVPAPFYLLGGHAVVSMIFLLLLYFQHTRSGSRTFCELLTSSLIAGGFSCGVLILSSLQL